MVLYVRGVIRQRSPSFFPCRNGSSASLPELDSWPPRARLRPVRTSRMQWSLQRIEVHSLQIKLSELGEAIDNLRDTLMSIVGEYA